MLLLSDFMLYFHVCGNINDATGLFSTFPQTVTNLIKTSSLQTGEQGFDEVARTVINVMTANQDLA